MNEPSKEAIEAAQRQMNLIRKTEGRWEPTNSQWMAFVGKIQDAMDKAVDAVLTLPEQRLNESRSEYIGRIEVENSALRRQLAELSKELFKTHEAKRELIVQLEQAESDKDRLDWLDEHSYLIEYKDNGSYGELSGWEKGDLGTAIDTVKREENKCWSL